MVAADQGRQYQGRVIVDLVIRNARLFDRASDGPFDIGVQQGRIVAIERGISADAEVYDACGHLACPGLIETHIHLDKSRIVDRCAPQERSQLSPVDRKSTRLNSSHLGISYAVFCLKKKNREYA